jgi:hypothetical protein
MYSTNTTGSLLGKYAVASCMRVGYRNPFFYSLNKAKETGNEKFG